MTKHIFTVLLTDKHKLTSALTKTMGPTDFVLFTAQSQAYDSVPLGEFETVAQAYQHALDNPGNHRSIQPGDFITSSEKRAWIVAGIGDVNEVTAKVGSVLFPNTVEASTQSPLEDDENDDADDGEAPCPGCGGYHGKPEMEKPMASTTLALGTIAQPRNCEREEMQAIMQKAVTTAFEQENIPLTRDHARRAIRSFLRLGVRLGLETGARMEHLMPLFFEAVEKESKALGKKSKARTVAVYAFEANDPDADKGPKTE